KPKPSATKIACFWKKELSGPTIPHRLTTPNMEIAATAANNGTSISEKKTARRLKKLLEPVLRAMGSDKVKVFKHVGENFNILPGYLARKRRRPSQWRVALGARQESSDVGSAHADDIAGSVKQYHSDFNSVKIIVGRVENNRF